jgi:hypothetical protein
MEWMGHGGLDYLLHGCTAVCTTQYYIPGVCPDLDFA